MGVREAHIDPCRISVSKKSFTTRSLKMPKQSTPSEMAGPGPSLSPGLIGSWRWSCGIVGVRGGGREGAHDWLSLCDPTQVSKLKVSKDTKSVMGLRWRSKAKGRGRSTCQRSRNGESFKHK